MTISDHAARPDHAGQACLAPRRMPGGLLRHTGGATAVEFALTAIPLFLFLLGIVEFGRIYWLQSELQYAAEAAARYASMNPTASSSTVQTYAASQVYGFTVPSSEFTLTRYSSATSTPACGNQVTASHAYSFFVTTSLVRYSVTTLQASGCHNG